VNKRFRVCDLNQPFLLSPSLQEWLPEDHLARFIADVMNELDLAAIYAEYERSDSRGLSAYHPLLLARLLLYGYCIGVTSSRKIEQATYDNVAFRYLAADQHPDHDTIAAFRQEHLEALAGLFVQALRLCEKAGLVKLGNVAIDGTKIMANASPRRSVSHKKLSEREQYWQARVEQLLAEAQRADEEEDQRFGKGQPADRLPDELAHAQSRLECIRKAKAELEEEAKQQLQAVLENHTPRKRGRPRKQDQTEQPPKNARQNDKAKKRLRRARRNAAEPTRQYNFVDPDSRVMKDNGRKCFIQGYNAQIAVDAHAQVIVAAELTQQTVDREQLVPMVQNVQVATQNTPETITADAGYWDTASLQDPALEGIRVLVAPDSKPQPPGAPLPCSAPRTEEAVRMRELLASETGKTLYATRKATVEPVFGQIKEGRGIRRFRIRGLFGTRCEWKFICATHNLLKLFRHRAAQAVA
jgi:transposase